ncbi:MAG: hypothetical protein LBC89_02180 [Bacteroidales bacterium]|nr:hypothetical protein [Bacteroidales bacterium]
MMKTQILTDTTSNPTGVFIPYSVWQKIIVEYPQIGCPDDIPQWEKDFIDKRLEILSLNKNNLKPIETLFENA